MTPKMTASFILKEFTNIISLSALAQMGSSPKSLYNKKTKWIDTIGGIGVHALG